MLSEVKQLHPEGCRQIGPRRKGRFTGAEGLLSLELSPTFLNTFSGLSKQPSLQSCSEWCSR